MPRKTAKPSGAEVSPSEIPLSHSLAVVDKGNTEIGRRFGGKAGFRRSDQWRMMKKHRWIIGSFFCLAIGVATLTMLGHIPLYLASTTLLIEGSQGAPLVSVSAGTQTPTATSQAYYQTQYAILKSRALAALVIQQEGLEESLEEGLTTELVLADPQDIFSRLWASTEHLWKSQAIAEDNAEDTVEDTAEDTTLAATSDSLPQNASDLTAADKNSEHLDIVSAYQELLDVRPIQNTRLVSIAFRTPDPVLSARLANAHAKAYLKQEWQLHTDWDDEARRFLADKLTDLKERIRQTEAVYQQVAAERGPLNKRDQTIVDHWTGLGQQLSHTEAERLLLEVQVYLGHKGAYGALADVLHSEEVQAMNAELQLLEKEYAKRLTQPESAETERISAEQLEADQVALNEARQRLVQIVQQQVRGIGDAYQTALEREAALKDSIQQYEADKLTPASPAIRAALVEQELSAQRWLLDTMQQQLHDLGTEVRGPASHAVVLDEARPPRAAVNPQGNAPFIFGAMIGLIGVGFTFCLEFFDNSLKTPQDVLRTLQLTPLSLIPDFDADTAPLAGAGILRKLQTLLRKGHSPQPPKEHRSPLHLRSGLSLEERSRVLSEQTFANVTEAYQTLREALRRSPTANHASTILFTSPTEGEGKTLTVCHTALLLAQAGHTVLVIDADGRRPDCRTLFGVEESPGLIELATGKRKRQVVKTTSVANLSFLACGRWSDGPTTFANFAELLASPQMAQLLTSWRDRYEYILLDTSPVLAGNEAVLLGAAVEHIVLVVDGQQATKQAVQQARTRLEGVAAKLHGAVLTKIDHHSQDYAAYREQFRARVSEPPTQEGPAPQLEALPAPPARLAPLAQPRAAKTAKPKATSKTAKVQAPSVPEVLIAEPVFEPELVDIGPCRS